MSIGSVDLYGENFKGKGSHAHDKVISILDCSSSFFFFAQQQILFKSILMDFKSQHSTSANY